jgi:hypothetical protein
MRNCRKSYMMRNQKKVRIIIPPRSSIAAYLESFESDDHENCSSDLDGLNDYGSEEEEVGAVIDDASHLLKCVLYI